MQEKLEATLAELVAFPSDSTNQPACRGVIEYALEQLEPLGLYISSELDVDFPWLVATTRATKQPKILLVAHLDVVLAADNDQYELKKDAGHLYGRGVWDMKYAAASYIELVKQHKDELSQLDIGIMFTTDEEVGGYQGVRQLLKDGWRTQLAFIPDYGEGWRIEESAKGIYSVKLSATGTSAHGSRPWEGDNAIHKLIPMLHELQAIYPSTDKYGPTMSINMLGGGDAHNQVANNSEACIDFRAPTPENIETYKALLTSLGSKNDIKIEEIVTGHPLILDKNHPLVRAYLTTLQDHGITPAYDRSFGGTDGRWFAEYNIPCIVTGPHGNGAHGANEWIRREDLPTFYQLLDAYVMKNARTEAA